MKHFRRLSHPYTIWATLVLLLPVILIMVYAFTTRGNDVKTLAFTLDNFTKFFNGVYLSVLFKSLKLAFITTVICLFLGYPIAYFISMKKAKHQGLLILAVTLPMWINMLLRTYAWQNILNEQGLLNHFLSLFNIGPVTLMYTEFAIVLGLVYNFLPFMILSIYTVLSKLDKSLIEASYDLGASPFKTFQKIILPLSMPGVFSGLVLVFLPAASTFVIPQILGGGQVMLIGNLIEQQFISVGDWNFGSAISMILAAIIFASMMLLRYIDTRGGKKDA